MQQQQQQQIHRDYKSQKTKAYILPANQNNNFSWVHPLSGDTAIIEIGELAINLEGEHLALKAIEDKKDLPELFIYESENFFIAASTPADLFPALLVMTGTDPALKGMCRYGTNDAGRIIKDLRHSDPKLYRDGLTALEERLAATVEYYAMKMDGVARAIEKIDGSKARRTA